MQPLANMAGVGLPPMGLPMPGMNLLAGGGMMPTLSPADLSSQAAMLQEQMKQLQAMSQPASLPQLQAMSQPAALPVADDLGERVRQHLASRDEAAGSSSQAAAVPPTAATSACTPQRLYAEQGPQSKPPAPVPVAPAATSGGAVRAPPPGIDPAVGDWPCPRAECGNWNWARRAACNKCGAPKVGASSRGPLVMAAQAASASAGHMGSTGVSAAAVAAAERKRDAALARALPSDGHITPQWNGRGKQPTHYSQAGSVHGGQQVPPGIDPSVGDWLCPCSNWNWAKRNNCNQCHRSKEDAAAGGKRTGEAGGFKEYDDEEASRRKRRLVEASQEKQVRRAEKKKCEYRKRFACIC